MNTPSSNSPASPSSSERQRVRDLVYCSVGVLFPISKSSNTSSPNNTSTKEHSNVSPSNLSQSSNVTTQITTTTPSTISTSSIALRDSLTRLEKARKITGRPNELELMSTQQLKEEKSCIKRELKFFDMEFARQNGKMPEKADKEPMRILYQRYKTVKQLMEKHPLQSKSSTLVSSSFHSSELTDHVKEEIWRLFEKFFEKEFADIIDFCSFLEGHYVLLMRKKQDQSLQGFIIVKILPNKLINPSTAAKSGGLRTSGFNRLRQSGNTLPLSDVNQIATIIQGDFFALSKEFRRSHSLPLFSLLAFCFKYKLTHPFEPLYYFFITYSYRSYLSFGRAIPEYYPCHFKQTPLRIKDIIDHLGMESCKHPREWGTYDSAKCVIRDIFNGQQGVLRLSSSQQIPNTNLDANDNNKTKHVRLDRTLEFFLEQNPGHNTGDCFCVICPISWSNFFGGFKKVIFRKLGITKSKRRRATLAANVDGNAQPKEENNVAFGMAIRKGDAEEDETLIRVSTFKVKVDTDVLVDLKNRLSQTKWPDEVDNENWQYGTNLKYMKDLVMYWAENYNWKIQESRLNQFPHFCTKIDDLNVHFVHVKSKAKNAMPLILLHGWPSTFYEFYKVIGPLTDPENFGGEMDLAFHVVVPSLPGYGFSEAPKNSGCDVKQIAKMLVTLMARLGYKQYGVQGSDWGGLIGSYMAILDPQHCVGLHLNLVLADFEPEGIWDQAKMTLDWIFRSWMFTPQEVKFLEQSMEYSENELAYATIQQSKPQSLGYAFSDSPSGLAAWIVEKIRSWTDCQGNIESMFSKDEILTHIMIYWVTNSITSSLRLYYETKKAGRWGVPEQKVEVPVGCAIFPCEVVKVPRKWAENVYNVQRWTVMPSGGHFPAQEEPQLLVDDLRAFFQVYFKDSSLDDSNTG